ncbi:MAG TPA: Fur family transcriptional regulator [Candidatus Micrarchaeia archaeon]|nr:Fur family transcriptional regulator [Candidatus Micrarchaeia archaeon]
MPSETTRSRVLAAGRRLTPQRDLIAQVLEADPRPRTAQELWADVRDHEPGIGRATVFRTLDALVEAGVAQRLTLPNRRAAYVGCSALHHHHFVCQECGAVLELPEPEVSPLLRHLERIRGFQVDHARLDFYGTCPTCLAAAVARPAARAAAPTTEVT